MARIIWDATGTHFYETGVDHGVLYKYYEAENETPAGFRNGVAWNGLTAVNESPSGADPSPLYADNIKYLNMMSAEQYGATIEAYTYPEEFEECDGSRALATGVYAGQQPRKLFGLCYRTLIGSDVQAAGDAGYKLHIIYNATASPSEKAHATVNENPDAGSMSWTVSTTPVEAPDMKPTASLVIDSTKVDAAKLAQLEDILYGDASNAPRLPYPAEIASIFGGSATAGIELNTHTITMKVGGSRTLIATTTPAGETVTWTTANSSVADVADGVVSGEGTGNTIITASITVDGVTYNDTCTVIVEAAS